MASPSQHATPAAPAGVDATSVALDAAAQMLESELEASLRAHSSRGVAAIDAHLSRALRALAPLEEGVSAAQKRVDAVVGEAEKGLEQRLRFVLAQVKGASIGDVAKRVAVVRDGGDVQGVETPVLEKEKEKEKGMGMGMGKKNVQMRRATRSGKGTKA